MDLEKHLIITAASTISFNDAIESAIKEVSKSIDYITGFSVLSQAGNISGNEIAEYLVDLDISFTVDLNRK